MKKLSLAIFALFVIASCTKEHSKDYISLSGKLENNKDSIITISGRTGVIKTISIKEDGSFKDTLEVPKVDIYTFQTSREKRAPIYLKNGFDISIKGDADKFMTSFEYSGAGSANTKFIVAQLDKSKKIGNPADILALEKEAFTAKMSLLKKEYDSILNSYNDLDSSLVDMATKQNLQMFDYFEKTYKTSKMMGKGKPSPKFENYVDFKGGKKSLDSFKGKYVYIDVWATWCGPCIREIPSLQKLEKEYHNKNIEFVSISTDESRRSGGSWEAAEKKWRDFVKEKQMGGVQLWAGQDYALQQAYQITGIPRFILIDPQGNIVDSNAPRPSDPRLKTLFNSLKI
ncbi:TlpA family protein disulfide reductase [Polaribacter sp. SA4-12]|uniref:TlpA family protein disulfide reductase n=1 Tax=Polaribacter sp. SA4-12 TaxID=1312072 RepID=UPI000B3C974A|nr:TlpA disulfide reductase family protein [Polaribacter sp. SA4-12]ARV14776.1 redoxin [Polaribacter sp. SA4-12]